MPDRRREALHRGKAPPLLGKVRAPLSQDRSSRAQRWTPRPPFDSLRMKPAQMLKGGPVTSLLEHLEGKYEILGQLEEDGAGETYRVRHLFLDEVRLFRVIRPPGKQGAEAGAGYLKEARAA